MKSGRSEHKESSPVQANEAENTSGRKKNTLIFACSGLSNTGKLTMLAASTLAVSYTHLTLPTKRIV